MRKRLLIFLWGVIMIVLDIAILIITAITGHITFVTLFLAASLGFLIGVLVMSSMTMFD